MGLRRLTVADDGIAAALLRGLLEAEGIPVLLRNAGSASWLFPGSPTSLAPVEVLVPADRLEEAVRLLREAGEAEQPNLPGE